MKGRNAGIPRKISPKQDLTRATAPTIGQTNITVQTYSLMPLRAMHIYAYKYPSYSTSLSL